MNETGYLLVQSLDWNYSHFAKLCKEAVKKVMMNTHTGIQTSNVISAITLATRF
jgi:hypothetical protein